MRTFRFGYGTATCGVNAAAGRNNNRTSMIVTPHVGIPWSTSYCYDNADRLTSSSTSNAPAGLNPVAAGITSTAIEYDTHGNTTKLPGQVLEYDSTDRALKTAAADGTGVTYVRDVAGRIVQRTQTELAWVSSYRFR